MENKARAYITENEAVEVPAGAYYLRTIFDGDLVEVIEPGPTSAKQSAKLKGAE